MCVQEYEAQMQCSSSIHCICCCCHCQPRSTRVLTSVH